MTTFSTGGSAVTFTTGTAVAFTTAGSTVSFSPSTGTAVTFTVSPTAASFTLPAAVTFDVSTPAATFTVNGNYGPAGPAGSAGVGVPVGGTAGQVLAKIDGTDYNTEWVNQSGAAGTTTLTGDVTGSGVGSITTTLGNTAVSAAAYGAAGTVATFTVNSQGRLTAAANAAISITPAQTQGTAVITSDSRLTDARTPTGSAGGDLTGTYPNPTLAAVVTAGTATKITYNAKGQVTAGSALLAADIPTILPAQVSGTAIVEGDTRLTNSRTPTAHATTHGAGGADPITTLGTVTTTLGTVTTLVVTTAATAPTPSVDDNDTSVATTAYVIGQAGTALPLIEGTAAAGTSLRWARQDHVHPAAAAAAAVVEPILLMGA